MRVWYVASDNLGGGRVRSFWPAKALNDLGWMAHASMDYPPLGWADIVVLHRPMDERKLPMIEALRSAGAVVLVDEDDCLHCLPDWHYAHSQITLPERLVTHAEAIRQADGLIVSTPQLGAEYGHLAKQTWLARNYLPSFVGSIHFRFQHPAPVRVGWQGISLTHSGDMRWFAAVAEEALRGAMLSIVGRDDSGRNPARLMGWTGPSEVLPFQMTAEALYKNMARADIGIVPLVDNSFNACKSWLKALEYMTLGKPVVVCNLPEQRALVEHGVTGFVAETQQEFAAYVQTLVRDPGLRERMGEAARLVGRRLALENMAGQWEAILRDARTGMPARERIETVIDEKVRCACGKLLMQHAARPWSFRCPRCKRQNTSPALMARSA